MKHRFSQEEDDSGDDDKEYDNDKESRRLVKFLALSRNMRVMRSEFLDVKSERTRSNEVLLLSRPAWLNQCVTE